MQHHHDYTVLANQTFYLNEFAVNPRTGEVSVGEKTTNVEPKVMNVLLYLTCRVGEVIDPEMLFEQVWPRSIYNPGSVRRCIGVLRKVLKDDSKHIILTHPKRGYSLQAEIRLAAKKMIDNSIVDKNRLDEKSQPRPKNLAILLGAALVLLLLVCSIWFYLWGPSMAVRPNPSQNQDLNIAHSLPVTATEQHESYPRFSPSGLYLVYIRTNSEQPLARDLWLKDLSTDQERRLTPESANIKTLSWGQDDTSLIYSVRDNAAKGISFYRLDFALGGTIPTTKRLFKRPAITRTSTIFWTQNNLVYFIAKSQGVDVLYRYDISSDEQSRVLTGNDLFKPYELALSYNQQSIAILGYNTQMQSQVKLWSITNNTFTDIATLNTNRYFISWHPSDDKILLGDGRHLKTLSLHGQLNKIAFDNFTFARYPQYSPDGRKIVLTIENIDLDIWLVPANNPAQKKRIINSNTFDWLARFSPDGTKVAYSSGKKGYPQLYVYDLKSAENRLVFDNPNQYLSLSTPIWHPNGNKIASSTNEQPFVIDLAGDAKANTPSKLTYLDYIQGIPQQWYHQQNALLMINHSSNEKVLAKLSLTEKHLTVLTKLRRRQGYLNQNDQLLLVSSHHIDKWLSSENLVQQAVVDGLIDEHFINAKGIYLKIRLKAKPRYDDAKLGGGDAQSDVQRWALRLFSFATSQLTTVDTIPPELNIWDIDAQGRQILTASEKKEGDIVILTVAD